jgi:signal transduction histidine kinase
MDTAAGANQERYLSTLQKLLQIPAANLKTALTHAANAVSEALGADKVDAFLYDDTRDSLVAMGTSTQPLSNLQKKLGLDVLPLSNGGRVVWVYRTGEKYRVGDSLKDPEELRGVREGLGIRAQIGVVLEVATQRRGMLMVASLKPDFFTDADAVFVETAARWVGMVAHRSELVENIERHAVEQGRKTVAEELITVLAHDLRNYVSPVVMRLYLLRHRAESERRAADIDDINVSLRGLARLNALVANLLDVARLDEGMFQIDLQPVDLVAMVKEAAAVLSTPENQILVETSDAVIVAADAARMRQCLDNVFTNAINHSPKNAPVSVFISRASKDGQTWGVVQVVDEGPGIPEELLPHIFDRFVTGRKDNNGLGLGLYLAKRIAAAHNGDLEADRFPGKGARFTIRIPLFE